jgi:CPA2 family monovalent cation:H+ antiporter-2
LQLGVIFAVGLPLLTLTQPFLPFGYSPALFVAILALLGVVFWESAVNLQEHVHAGAQMVADALSSHSHKNQDDLLEQINAMVPGIGAPTTTSVGPESFAAGKTLGDLNLRSLTGASVIAVMRGSERILMPSGKEIMQAGDSIVLVGTHEAIHKAKELFQKTLP